MTWEHFEVGLQLARDFELGVTLGGGEPTLHDDFWEMAAAAYDALGHGRVGVITNGAETEKALELLRWHERGLLNAYLSLDRYHQAIASEVAHAYDAHGLVHEVTPEFIADLGRARTNALGRSRPLGEPICPCNEPMLTPSGELFTCGCLKKSLGTDMKAWHMALHRHFMDEPYACASLAEWKRERVEELRRNYRSKIAEATSA